MVDDPEIMPRQVPAVSRTVVQTVQKTVETPQLHGCRRPCDHEATSSDEFVDQLMTILRMDFRSIVTEFFGLRPSGRRVPVLDDSQL